MKLRTSSSQDEGAKRIFSAVTTRVDGATGAIQALHFEREGESFEIPADLVLLAMGFTGPPPGGVVETAGVEINRAGYATSRDRIFACGDMRRGQSLVVWAIREGRECADKVDHYLRTQDASL